MRSDRSDATSPFHEGTLNRDLMSPPSHTPSWRTVIVAGLIGFLVNAVTPTDAFGIAAFVIAVAFLHVTEKRHV